MGYRIEKFGPELIKEFDELQAAYRRVYPEAIILPGAAYLTPGFADGENVMCALDDPGKLCGYAAVYSPVKNPYRPITFWVVTRLYPGLDYSDELRDLLFENILKQVSVLSQGLSVRGRRLAFQYHASELSAIDFISSKGAIYAESLLRVRRDLSIDMPVLPAVAGVEIRFSQMKDETEQRSYVWARNRTLFQGRDQKIQPPAIDFTDWRNTLKNVIKSHGTVLLACDSGRIIGSIVLFWNEEENRRTGREVGTIDNVFVRKGWRRQGIASCMLCRGFEYFKGNGLEFARLDVNSANLPALKLYENLGFVTVYESRMFVLPLD